MLNFKFLAITFLVSSILGGVAPTIITTNNVHFEEKKAVGVASGPLPEIGSRNAINIINASDENISYFYSANHAQHIHHRHEIRSQHRSWDWSWIYANWNFNMEVQINLPNNKIFFGVIVYNGFEYINNVITTNNDFYYTIINSTSKNPVPDPLPDRTAQIWDEKEFRSVWYTSPNFYSYLKITNDGIKAGIKEPFTAQIIYIDFLNF